MQLDLPGARVSYHAAFLSEADAGSWLGRLQRDLEWRQDRISLFGQQHDLPRLQAWYGDAGARYTYSGMALEPLPWTDDLLELRDALIRGMKDRCAEHGAARFNSVLANLYRDGRDSNGWHADDEPELGRQPLIASLSFGATRRFRMKRRDGTHDPVSLDLESGSLLVMSGETQRKWQHHVPKTARAIGPRINLTWRWIERST